MANNTIRIRAVLDDKVSGPLGKMRDKFDTLGKNKGFQSLFMGVGAGAGIAAFNLLGRAVSGFTGELGDAITAAMEDQRSQQQLRTSLQDNIPAWDGNTKAIEKVLAARMKLGFSDDEQRVGLATLVASTHDYTKGLDLERGAMDIARARGLDLATVSDALAKAFAGNTKQLKTLIPGLKLGATSAETIANAFSAVKGSAEDYANTTGGKLLVVQTQFNEALEGAGYTLLPIVTAGLETLTDAMDRTGRSYEEVAADAAKGSVAAQARLRTMEAEGQHWKSLSDFMSAADEDYNVALDSMGNSLRPWVQANESGTDRVIVSFDDMVSAMKSDASDLIDKVYGPSEEKAKLTADRIEAANLRRQISSGKLTKAEMRDAKERLREVSQDADEQRLALLSSGDLSDKDAKKWLASLRRRYKTEMGSAKKATGDLIREIQRLIDITDGGTLVIKVNIAQHKGGKTAGKDMGQNWSGGFIPEGSWGTSGERGTESLYANPGGGVTVKPTSGGGGNTYIFQSLWPPTAAMVRQVQALVDREGGYALDRMPPYRGR